VKSGKLKVESGKLKVESIKTLYHCSEKYFLLLSNFPLSTFY